MLAIVVSRADGASEHVGEHLLALADWDESVDDSRPETDGGGTVYRLDDAELRTFETLHLETTRVADAFDEPDLLAFASRHAGETGPLLTAHHTGNFGPAKFGGSDGSLARACPNAHRRVVQSLTEHAPDGYDVGMECTHHGPSEVGAPSLFVELGSAEEQWADPDAARAVARAILDLRGVAPDGSVENSPEQRSTSTRSQPPGNAVGRPPSDEHSVATAPRNAPRRHLVGFGGGHYAPRFERVVRETDWAVGHVAADWCLDAMGDPHENERVVRRAFEQSAAQFALLEGDRPALRETIESLGYRVVGETWVRETSGVPLGLVDRVETSITAVDDGLRFGEGATEYGGAFEVTSLPQDLLAEASGIDAGATRAAVASTTIAFDTEQNGTRVVGPVAVRRLEDVDVVVDALVDVLRQSYDEVTRTDDGIIARKRAFDPALAREEGVPEGPMFGRLSEGESVEVDGQTVAPEDVLNQREFVFNC